MVGVTVMFKERGTGVGAPDWGCVVGVSRERVGRSESIMSIIDIKGLTHLVGSV